MNLNQHSFRVIIKSLITAFIFVFMAEPSRAHVDDSATGNPVKTRILYLTQSQGFVHNPVRRKGDALAFSETALIKLGQESGLFEVDCTQNAADINRKNLEKYQIVAFYTTGKLPIEESEYDYFQNVWLKEKGHGFIGIHSATDTYKDFKPYWDMIGGSFNGHPWNQGSVDAFTVHDPDHPTMRSYNKKFMYQDEIYQYKNWQPEKVRVLMSLDMSKSDIKRPYHVPVAWVKEWGDGKIFYTNLGHRPETWEHKPFQDSILGAVRWIRGMEDGNAVPNPQVSKEEENKAMKAAAAGGVTKESLAAQQKQQEQRRRNRRQQRQRQNSSEKK